jgi:hypothetical protein
MNKLDDYMQELLIFMKNEVEDKAVPLNTIHFNFSLSTTERYFNAPDEVIPDGEDLITFRKIVKINDNTIFKKIFSKAKNEGYIKCPYMNGKDNSVIELTGNGLKMAKAIQANKKSAPKKAITNITDKIIYPIVSGVISAVLASVISYFIMSNFQDKKIDTMNIEIKKLKKDITWMKQKL